MSTTTSLDENDTRNLKILLDTFGSAVSLEDMASAYAEAGKDLQVAAGKLCSMQPGNGSSLPKVESRNAGPPSSEWGTVKNPRNVKSKSRVPSVSIGTVSNVIGKDYMKRKANSFGVFEKAETVKLSCDDIPSSDKSEPEPAPVAEPLDSNVGEFLFKMLGDGFQLEKSVVQDVIGQCGYNMSTSIDKLVDLSAGTLEKNDDLLGSGTRDPVNSSSGNADAEAMLPEPGYPCVDPLTSSEEVALPETEIKGKNIQKEVLQSLFTFPEKGDEKPVRHPLRKTQRAPYGEIVSKPLEENMIQDFTFITRCPVKRRDPEVNESCYEDLRQAVKEYWSLMKDYLKAGADAYTRDDYEKAKTLMEMGAFYMKKAREADEKSAQNLIDDRDQLEDLHANMHYFAPKAALDQMKLLLTTLAGMPYVRNLKLVTGTNHQNKPDRQRKRAITKLLEKEGISWTTEGDEWTICINLADIDHKKVSFTNK